MMSLVNISFKLWSLNMQYTLVVLLKNMWVALLHLQKLLTFFSKNTCELDIVLTRTVNILTTNKLTEQMVLWITGPWYFSYYSIQTFVVVLIRSALHWDPCLEFLVLWDYEWTAKTLIRQYRLVCVLADIYLSLVLYGMAHWWIHFFLWLNKCCENRPILIEWFLSIKKKTKKKTILPKQVFKREAFSPWLCQKEEVPLWRDL